MKIKFGVSFRPESLDQVTDWCQLAEKLGYSRIGISDSVALYREPWVTLTTVGQHTKSIPLGIWMTNPLLRHPAVTAGAAATLNELIPGRICIGIATGNAGVYNLGYKASSINQLREYVKAIRSLLHKGRVNYMGRKAISPWSNSDIPIYIAAHGSKSLHLAGEIADGVLIGLGISEEAISSCLEVLEAGAKKTGRSIDDIDIWWITHREVNSIPGTAQKLVSGMVADNAILLSRFTLNGKFIPEKYKDSIIKLGQSYDLTTHGYSNALTNYAEIAENLGIAQYLVKRFAIAGTPDECISQINTAAQAGARQFMVSLPGPNRPQKLHDWHDLVMTQV